MTERLEALRELLQQGALSTQEELREKLERLEFKVTQSTISRDLRRLNAVRATDENGQIVYRLPDPALVSPMNEASMVTSIETASTLVVIHTTPGTASLVARHLDHKRPPGVIGTIAGDDTVFLAFAGKTVDPNILRGMRETLRELD